MLTEPMTLYKLMNLYMLHQVNFPLTNAQLSNFFLDREYTTYFTLQQALNELLDAGLVKKETMRNSSRYEITKEGEETLEFFGKNISPAIVSDMDEYLKQNRFRMRNEVGLISDFYKSTNQDYIVHCEVREVLGESYVAEYQKMKRREWKNYLEQVTKWELEQYLYLV